MDRAAVREKWLARDGEHAWLEEVKSDTVLDWVRARNDEALGTLGEPTADPLYDRVLSILESKDTIPHVRKIGPLLYNFWRDAEHVRGLWRRTTFESYRTPDPVWEPVLDLDALSTAEGVTWVWCGHVLLEEEGGLPPTRTILKLSREGADATEKREFDLGTKQFVEGGFTLPEAKSVVSWLHRDLLLVGTDTGPGSMTASGYPRTVREWRRGTPLADAPVVFEVEETDISASGYFVRHVGHAFEWRRRSPTFYTNMTYVRPHASADWTPLPVPLDASPAQFRDQVLVTLRTDWVRAGTTYPQGALLAFDLPRLLRDGDAAPATVLFTPTPAVSLDAHTCTRNYVILNLLDCVKARLHFWKFEAGEWVDQGAGGEARIQDCHLSAVDSDEGDEYFLTTHSFLQPSTLSLADAALGPAAPSAPLKALPPQFEAQGLTVQQLHGTSADGTRVPYFLVHREDIPMDGSTPTLLYGYGGFEINLTPSYDKVVGAAWLEHGGCYALPNCRGGGEFGPQWHQAAVKANRQKSYDDFYAVAEDLIARRITSPARLGIRGGSNGGLLMGMALVQRPELFGAVVCDVPLLDMHRYHKLLAGHSWMEEYGDPDTEDWAFLQRYSPYHNLDPAASYPPLLMTTSTRDDRVHPYHARAFLARLRDMGKGDTVFYYENIQGGHGGAADKKQLAYITVLYISFLRRHICPN